MSDWYQQQLTPSEVYELNIRVGVIPATDHAQAMCELKDPLTGVMIAQWSAPHESWSNWPTLLEAASRKAMQQLGEALEPF